MEIIMHTNILIFIFINIMLIFIYIYSFQVPYLLSQTMYFAEWGQTDETIGTVSQLHLKAKFTQKAFTWNYQRLYKNIYLRTLEPLKISDSSHSQESNTADSLSSKWELCNTNKIISQIQMNGAISLREKPADITESC